MFESTTRSSRIGRWVLAVVTVPVAAMAMTVAPASAATTGISTVSSWEDCPAGWFCAWENADATGHWARFQQGSPDLTKAINGYVFNDKFQYAYNNTGSLWGLYENIEYDDIHGRYLLIKSGWRGPLAPKYNFAKLTSSLSWLVP
ncbi:peptidase inhibitor family I36 protein [Amycolatopsis sp., V23-08]|uniref:Peptidase inhibitor family I36 protein n=1 Tax=Amycolatopsis heterodermiae TaxID=3110235 RepID=A0ABU5RHP4_9PSEU|nr:peptidase inhibitor family I36 protein [Amycolatopsis sp., V23-08]MEA5365798.1 peptidase inhibitor family I36 protein [Amycolatopsis sp., V23-08]